tara:strand:- start:321 stop:941 length:621 start_codon:yes stop_codon:yes gene_type:complete
MEMTQESFDKLVSDNEMLATANKDLRKESAAKRTDNKDLLERLDELEADKKKSQSDKEHEGLEAKGEYEKALQKVRDDSLELINKANGKADKLAGQYKSTVIDKALIEAASDTVSPRQALLLAKDKYTFGIDDDGGVSISIGDAPATGEDGKALTIDGVIALIKDGNPNLVASKGNGSGSLGGKGNNDVVTSRDKIAAGLNKLGLA